MIRALAFAVMLGLAALLVAVVLFVLFVDPRKWVRDEAEP